MLLLLHLITPGVASEEATAPSALPPFFRQGEMTSNSSSSGSLVSGSVSPEDRFPQTSVGFYLLRMRRRNNEKQQEMPAGPRNIDWAAILESLKNSAAQQSTATPPGTPPGES